MARIRFVNFPNREEAEAFVRGIEYVNDGVIEVLEYGDDFVLLEDGDAEEDGVRNWEDDR